MLFNLLFTSKLHTTQTYHYIDTNIYYVRDDVNLTATSNAFHESLLNVTIFYDLINEKIEIFNAGISFNLV